MGPALIAHWSVADINWTTELVWLQDSLTFQCKSQNFLPIFFFSFFAFNCLYIVRMRLNIFEEWVM